MQVVQPWRRAARRETGWYLGQAEPTERPAEGQQNYTPYGAAREALHAKNPELILDGPSNTGKSRGLLEKLHICACKYPKARLLICRKTRKSITQSAQVTFETKVLPAGWRQTIRWHHEAQEYRYPNGARIIVGGLDDPQKVMSTEFDVIYVQEARDLAEGDWEALITRARNHAMPYQQVIGDTNPDVPYHWIRQRASRGVLRLIQSRHADNPMYSPEDEAALQRLTGVRYKRLYLGLWVAAEGQVYEDWDPAVHMVYGSEVPEAGQNFITVDFGYTNPFCAQWWRLDADGRLYRYRELYHTRRLVEDHARQMRELTGAEPIRALICDHDAEGRATLEKYFGMSTTPARKAIHAGIQAVQARLRPAGDGRPRLFLVRDARLECDGELQAVHKPTCTEDEFEGYVWDERAGRRRGELPVDEDNHGMDCVRYACAHFDLGRHLRVA